MTHVLRLSPIIASTNNAKVIVAIQYQMIDGFTRIPVASDGNCFYTAMGFFCELTAAAMRHLIIKYFIFKKAEYSIFFESQAAFIKAIQENSMPRIWNTDLGDILPHAAAHLLQREVIVHNYDGKKIKEIRIPVTSCILGPTIHLFRSNCHYEILLINTIPPNKNICAIPDIDLTFKEEEGEEEEEEVEEEEVEEDEEEEEVEEDEEVEEEGGCIYDTGDEECMIRM
jgi:hypothetical protein